MKNELILFCARNSQSLALNDRQKLISLANQIDAMRTVQDEKERKAVRQVIIDQIAGLQRIANAWHTFPSTYADVRKLEILKQAIDIALKLLRA